LDPSPIQFCFYIKIRSYKLLPLDVAMLPHGNNLVLQSHSRTISMLVTIFAVLLIQVLKTPGSNIPVSLTSSESSE
jgi:hypothetical protein